ncbi:MAG: hypothetical protein CMP76_16140 [Flavobacterium sp.]|uniref:hypothetical protein n=1 Tax=Flavobacterium sp. TaxID=239 RepID=UPI000C63908C|nr:hypothetical protein [Flavobacterium sp.]MBF04812.1 hypothetical protein [Flavobacterium sp.]
MIVDFTLGIKVSLNGEFGVVINSVTDENNLCGLIRWDTSTISDIEDWRGQFGTFISLGGKIINQDYEFKFINNNGTLKNG